MFGLTKKTGYGLAALSYLAGRPDRWVCARVLSEQLSVPVSLLMNVLKELAGAGYVESIRGAHGGYRVARPPEEIHLGELVRDLEGPIRRSECLRDRPREGDRAGGSCRAASACPHADPLHRVHRKLRGFLDDLTLADIMVSAGRADAAGTPAGAGRQDAENAS